MKIKYIMYNVQDYAVLHDTICSVEVGILFTSKNIFVNFNY